MKSTAIIGTAILAALWIWLSWGVLSGLGVTLYSLLIVGMSGFIVFAPLWRKYGKGSEKRKNNGPKP